MYRLSTRRTALVVAIGALAAGNVATKVQIAAAYSGEIVTLPMLSATFTESPPAPAFVAVTRTILPPRTSISSGETAGPRLIVVESGDVELQSSVGNAGFLRAADASPGMASISGGITDAVLHPSDTFRLNKQAAIDFVNTGSHAAIYLDLILFPKPPLGMGPFTTMDGVVVDPLVGVVADALPVAPVHVRIDRLELAQGVPIDLASVDGPRLIVVESGTLGVSVASGVITYSSAAGLNPGSTAGRSRTVPTEREMLLRARGSIVVHADATGTLCNLGRNQLHLFWVQIQSVASIGQP